MGNVPSKISVVGSANVDLVVEVERFPGPGETLPAHSYSVGPGGKGGNQALAAATAGGDVRFIAAIGDDDHGRVAVGLLRDAGVDLTDVAVRREVPTGSAHIAVDAKGENTIVVVAGANGTMTADVVEALEPLGGVVLVQGEIPRSGIEAAARQASAGEARLIVNLAPVIEVSAEVITAADPLVANEHEVCLLAEMLGTSVSDREAAVQSLLQRGVRSIVVTLGGSGSLVAWGEERVSIPAPQMRVVDTTGAGDAFTGALAAELARGQDLVGAARFASRFAAATVTHAGAQASYGSALENLPELPA